MIEAQTDQYSEDEATIYIANPDSNPALMAEYNKLRKMLGLKKEVMQPLEEETEETPAVEPKT